MHPARRALTGAIVAAAILTAGSAPEVASGSDVVREAEHMALRPIPTRAVRWPKVLRGRTESGGGALHFGRNGSATTTVNAQEISAVTLRARGTSCAGPPVAAVTIDGVRVGARPVTSGKWTDYRLPALVRRAAIASRSGSSTIALPVAVIAISTWIASRSR